MRRTRHAALLSPFLAAALLITQAGGAAATTVSFGSSYAVEMDSYGGGSVTYKFSSGISNYLRATAAGDVVSPSYVLVSIRQGRIGSTSVHYTGATGGSITLRASGQFSRDLSGGISFVNGAGFRHQIGIALRDVTAGTDTRLYTFVDEEILCGGLVYPIGFGGCNGATSDVYPSSFSRTASGSGIVKGHYYLIRVYVASIIQAVGVVAGLQARTTATSLSGSLTW
jgi:hypothetical protein